MNQKIPTRQVNRTKMKYVKHPEQHIKFQEEYSTSQSKVLVEEEKSGCCVLL